jgi:hypothetical protein
VGAIGSFLGGIDRRTCPAAHGRSVVPEAGYWWGQAASAASRAAFPLHFPLGRCTHECTRGGRNVPVFLGISLCSSVRGSDRQVIESAVTWYHSVRLGVGGFQLFT